MTENKLTTRDQLELIDAIPHGPEREKMLRLMLAEAWHEGWECCYGDGGQDNNAYMTGREIKERREQAEADHNAYVMAQVTGSRGSTYTVEHADGSSTTGSYSRAEDVPPPLYVPTRSECNAMKEQSKRELLEAGIDPKRWDLDGMKCSHGEGPGSHVEDTRL